MFTTSTRKDLLEKLSASEDQLNEASAEIATLQASLDEARSQAANFSADLDAATKQVEALTEQVDEQTVLLATAQAKLDTFDKEVATAAQAKSDEYLAQMGHEPLDLEADGDDPDEGIAPEPAEVLSKLEDPGEAFQYAKENRQAILEGLFPNRYR